MRQIKDMLTKESSEATDMNKKIENILEAIEDLRKHITSKATSDVSSDSHHSKPTTKTTKGYSNITPHKFVVKIEETPTTQHET